MKKSFYVLALILIIVLVGCNLPTTGQTTPSSPEAAFTQAAQTVAAELTRVALLASPTSSIPTNTPIPTNTSTPAPTNTPIYTPTNTPIPCNLAGFISDVTVPDNTAMTTSQTFTKTWRLRNIGTCTWTSSYKAAFDHGDGMGLPAGYEQSLTSGTIPSGGTVDISVNLTAPAANGTYTGYWHLREPGGNYFRTNFIVKIKVFTSTTVTLAPVVAESGAVRSDSSLFPGDIVVGDSTDNFAIQAFISYDISSIPSNATIIEVKNSFNSYTPGGNPFGHLGVLNGYLQNFTTPVIAGNFIAGFPNGNIVDWGSTTALDNIEVQPTLKTTLQGKLGSARFKLRLQFAGTNGDGVADYVRFTNPSLIVKYVIP